MQIITVSRIALGASFYVSFASSLIVHIKSKPVIAKNKIVVPVTIPPIPYSYFTKGVMFEIWNRLRATKQMKSNITNFAIVRELLKLAPFFVPKEFIIPTIKR